MTNRAEMTRRDILKSGAAASTVTLAPGVTLMAFGGTAEASSRADAGKRWGLLIDASKCASDCSACVTATWNETCRDACHGCDVAWRRPDTSGLRPCADLAPRMR